MLKLTLEVKVTARAVRALLKAAVQVVALILLT